MTYSVQHARADNRSHWYLLERFDEAHREEAFRRARNYALDHGGYVCVTDHAGNVVYGTDPAELARADQR